MLTLDAPERMNTISPVMLREISELLLRADADPEVRCIVLTGQGRAFTVGQDLSEFSDPRHGEPDGGFRGLMRALSQVPVPLVAAVNGMAGTLSSKPASGRMPNVARRTGPVPSVAAVDATTDPVKNRLTPDASQRSGSNSEKTGLNVTKAATAEKES